MPTIVHFDITSDNIERTKKLYTEGEYVFITGPSQSEVDAAVIWHIYNM